MIRVPIKTSDGAMHNSTGKSSSKCNVCLQGASLDVGNRGCRALAASFIKLVLEHRPDAQIYLLYGNRKNGVQKLQVGGRTVELNIVNYRLSPKSSLNEHIFWILFLACVYRIMPLKWVRNKIIQSNKWLTALENAHFVGEIRGGDSLSDIYGLRRFLLGIIPCVVAILTGKEVVLLPQTYGPFRSKTARLIARHVFLNAHQIFARDTESIELVHNLLGAKGKGKTVRFCPDIAFALEVTLPDKPVIQPELPRNDSLPLIGLNVSGLLYIGGYTRNNMFGLNVNYKELVHELLKELLEETNSHILLIPHELLEDSEINELTICRSLFDSFDKRYPGRIHLVNKEYDQSEIKGIIGLCDFFIGSRMHACIAAMSQGIPTIGLAYSKKFAGVFQSVGADKLVIDMRQKTTKEILDSIRKNFQDRHAVAEKLQSVVSRVQEQISEVFGQLL